MEIVCKNKGNNYEVAMNAYFEQRGSLEKQQGGPPHLSYNREAVECAVKFVLPVLNINLIIPVWFL